MSFSFVPSLARSGLGRASLIRVVSAPPPAYCRCYVTDIDVARASEYCQQQLKKYDYDAHMLRRVIPHRAQQLYAALRTLNAELVRLPDSISNPTIGNLRIQFWRDAVNNVFAGNPPRQPICILIHHTIQRLREHPRGPGSASSLKFWLHKFLDARAAALDNRPYPSIEALESHAEGTYSTLMYMTLAALPVRSVHVDHLASHIGKAVGIVAAIRGIPVLASPPQHVETPSGLQQGTGQQVLALPLDILAKYNVKDEEVFRKGPEAEGLGDAVFAVATRANDHLITARTMLHNLRRGKEPGHAFEHAEEEGHVYENGTDETNDLARAFPILLEAIPAQTYLKNLERAAMDPWSAGSSWNLPWRLWRATSKNEI